MIARLRALPRPSPAIRVRLALWCLLVCGVVLSAVYLIGLHLLRVPTEAERQAARTKLGRLRNLFRPRPATLAAPATPGESK